MKNVRLPDYHDYSVRRDARVEVESNPDAIFFKGTQSSTIKAFICADCGLIEQYVDDTQSLWAAYQSANQNT